MTLQQQIRANRWRTIWLLLLFALLVAGVGLLLAFIFDPTILTVVAIGGIGYAIVSWFASSSMVAGITGAKQIEKRDNPYLYRLLENVSIAAGLEKTPELRLVDDPAPNAFAAGRSPKHAFVAVTTGLVDLLDERELEAVLAHEVSHIRNRDVRLMTLVALLVGVIALLARHLAPHGVLRRQQARELRRHHHGVRSAAARAGGRGHHSASRLQAA